MSNQTNQSDDWIVGFRARLCAEQKILDDKTKQLAEERLEVRSRYMSELEQMTHVSVSATVTEARTEARAEERAEARAEERTEEHNIGWIAPCDLKERFYSEKKKLDEKSKQLEKEREEISTQYLSELKHKKLWTVRINNERTNDQSFGWFASKEIAENFKMHILTSLTNKQTQTLQSKNINISVVEQKVDLSNVDGTVTTTKNRAIVYIQKILTK